MKKLIIVLSLAGAGLNTFAQVSLQERAYRLDSFYKFIKISDIDRQGNVMFSGLIRKTHDIHICKRLLLKSNTDTLWTAKGPEVDNPFAYPGVRARVNGNFSFITYTMKPGPLNDKYDVFLQKNSETGSILLNKTLNPANDNNYPNNFLTTPDKGYLILGGGGMPGVTSNTVLTRTDSLGNILWQKNHGKRFYTATYMERTLNNRTIIAGSAPTPNPGVDPYRIKLVLINAAGDSVRANTLALNSLNQSELMFSDNSNSLTPLLDGGFLITAYADTVNLNANIYGSMGVVAKIDSNLQVAWRYIKRADPASNNGINFIRAKELNDGTLLVLGRGNQQNQFKLFRFTPWGTIMNTYDVTSTLFPNVRAATMECLPDSSILIGGQCYTAGNAQNGFYVAKVKIQGLPPVMPPPFFVLNAKPELASTQPPLGQSYPNPAQDQTIIPYHLPNSTRNAKILITDITGREVGSYSLKTSQKQGSLPVNLNRLFNGLYLYSLVIDGKPVATKKLAVAR